MTSCCVRRAVVAFASANLVGVAETSAQQAAAAAAPPADAAATSDRPKLFELEFGDTKLAVPGWAGAKFWAEGRWRSEHWSHFEAPGKDGDYAFNQFRFRQGLSQKVGFAEIGFEWQTVHAFGLDDDPTAGPGKNYADFNRSSSPQSLSVRQLWVDLDCGGAFVRGGRQLYEDNAGVKYDDAAFQWVRERGNARLVGNLDWTAAGRTWDGVSFRREDPSWLVRAVAFEANEGAFDVEDANESLEDVQVGGLELISKRGALVPGSEARLFGYAFRDDRAVTVARFGDELFVTTAGAQLATRFAAGPGAFDGFAWVALQRGDAGARAQRSGAWILETGYRFEELAWKPWLRAGHARGQGDSSSTDGEVNDFHNGLPTNHTYYGFIDLFALTNLRDSYVDFILDPHPQLRFMASAHVFAANDGDAKTSFGSGAFTTSNYGYGTFSTTSRNLGQELDLTLRATTTGKRVHALLGWSCFKGGTAFERLFPAESDITLGYLEVGFKF